MTKNRKKRNRWICITLCCLLLFAWFTYENKHLVVTHYEYRKEEIEDAIDGWTIVQISDLHNTSFGRGNQRLIQTIKKEHPDMIVITGDLVDAHRTNIKKALSAVSAMTNICPVYYVTGNHEKWLSKEKQEELYVGLQVLGVNVLADEKKLFSGAQHSYIIGLDDAHLQDETLAKIMEESEEEMKENTKKEGELSASFSLLLAHEPIYIERYRAQGVDLVLSGHEHGGQFILPGLGPIISAEMEFFPTMTAGEIVDGKTTMIISRGLGNSVIPVRIGNKPEIVVIHLEK